MGTVVLEPGPSPAASLHLYAHCLRGVEGGVALLAINTDRAASPSLELPWTTERYTLTAHKRTDKRVQMNGGELKLGDHDELPMLENRPGKTGRVSFAPVLHFSQFRMRITPLANDARAGRAIIRQGLTET